VRRWLAGMICAVALASAAGCDAPSSGVDGDLVNGWAPVPAPRDFRPPIGRCFDKLVPTAPLDGYTPYDCRQQHVAETFFVGTLTGAAAAKNARSSRDIDGVDQAAGSPAQLAAGAVCARRADAFVGAAWRTGRLQLQPVLPGEDGWAAGARWFRCDIAQNDVAADKPARRTGSLRGSLAGAAPALLRCFNPGASGEGSRTLKRVDCARPHHAEFAGLWTAPAMPFDRLTGDPRLAAGCRSAIARYTKIPDDRDVRFRLGWLGYAPSREEWSFGVRDVQCFLWLPDRTVTGSYRAAGPAKLPVNVG
jgi:putative regulator of septum formation